jgi:NAD(P)-dependent dehydrogenase (short-subunit alcohol dehydrogenase family)
MHAMQDLNGRVAVITGGASGIGKGMAQRMIAEGARVVIADIERDALEATADEIGAVGIVADVSDLASVEALAAQTVDRFGTVDIICNNAGVAPKVKIADATIDDWRWVIDVNLWGVIHGVKAFLPILRANPNGGYVVNTASSGGFMTGPMIGPYSVTKSGVVALSEALAWELQMEGARIGVTIFCPGTVRTNLHTSSRNRPGHLADAAAIDIDMMNNKALLGDQRWLKADDMGAIVTDAMRRGALYVTTHPEIADLVEMRMHAVAAAFRHPIPEAALFE